MSPRAAKQQKQKITPFLQVTAADLGMPLSVGARLLWMFLRLHCCRCRDEDGAPVYETKIITLDTLVEALGGGTVAKEVGVRGQPGAKVAKECARFGRDAISAAIKELVDGGHIEARRTNRGAYRNVFHFSIAKTAPVDDRQSPVEVA